MNKLLKAMIKSGRDLLIIIPLTLGVLVSFGVLFQVNFVDITYTKPWSYAFWGGLPLAWGLGIITRYDEENKI